MLKDLEKTKKDYKTINCLTYCRLLKSILLLYYFPTFLYVWMFHNKKLKSLGHFRSIGWASSCRPKGCRFDSGIHGQGTYPGFGFDPWSWHVWEGNLLRFLSYIYVSLSVPSSLSKSNGKISSDADFKKLKRKK